jgi:hypothetical protein
MFHKLATAATIALTLPLGVATSTAQANGTDL